MAERLGGRPKMDRTKVSAYYDNNQLATLDGLVADYPKTKRPDAIRFAIEFALSSPGGHEHIARELSELHDRYSGIRKTEPVA